MFQNWIERNRFNWISKMLSKYAGEPIFNRGQPTKQPTPFEQNLFPIPSDVPYYSFIIGLVMPKFGSGTDKLTSCDQFSEKNRKNNEVKNFNKHWRSLREFFELLQRFCVRFIPNFTFNYDLAKFKPLSLSKNEIFSWMSTPPFLKNVNNPLTNPPLTKLLSAKFVI